MAIAPPDDDCPFCIYARGGSNALLSQEHVVDRTDTTLTFVSPKWWPNNAGHLIVVPVEHHESLYDLPESLAVPLQRATKAAALALKHAYGCQGISTRQHNERAGNQDIWHFHVHVFPRYDGDRFYATEGEYVSSLEMTERAHRLRAAYAARR